MPVTYGSYIKQLKLLPVVLNSDGTALITVRYGYVGSDNVFVEANSDTFKMEPQIVASILDAPPTAGMTRRDDLSLAIYQYLVSQGLVQTGDIS